MAAWSTGPATSLVRVVVVGPDIQKARAKDRQNVKTFEAWCLGDLIARWSRCPHILVWSSGQTYKKREQKTGRTSKHSRLGALVT